MKYLLTSAFMHTVKKNEQLAGQVAEKVIKALMGADKNRENSVENSVIKATDRNRQESCKEAEVLMERRPKPNRMFYHYLIILCITM